MNTFSLCFVTVLPPQKYQMSKKCKKNLYSEWNIFGIEKLGGWCARKIFSDAVFFFLLPLNMHYQYLFLYCLFYNAYSINHSPKIKGKGQMNIESCFEACVWYFLFFHQMIAFQKLWKIFLFYLKSSSLSSCQQLLQRMIEDKFCSLWRHQLSK